MKQLRSGDTFVTDFEAKCGCGNCATHLLTMHAVDWCTPEEPTTTFFICNPCLTKAYKLADELISMDAVCSTCDLQIDQQCGIIVSLIPVRQHGGAE